MLACFQRLTGSGRWLRKCLYRGMSIWIILFSLQVIATIYALLHESGKDTQFDGDKLDFRS